ncbi:hypothetical protein TSMEX_005902 [Taenia solium]|eukprot:TsM_000324500 transcript=TsM_000324500 gene=TsM_000324500
MFTSESDSLQLECRSPIDCAVTQEIWRREYTPARTLRL